MIKKFWVSTLSLLLFSIVLLAFSDDLAQNNKEDLFLSKEYAQYLDRDRKLNPVYDAIVLNVQFESELQWQSFHKFLTTIENDFEDLMWMSPQHLSKKDSLFEQDETFKQSNLLKMSDQGDTLFFFYVKDFTPSGRESFVNKVSDWCFVNDIVPRWVGMPYLNVKLGEMSKQIKQFVMPVLFIVVAILLRVLLGSSIVTIATFVPSLFGVGLSLVLIKLMWGHSTMVTTLVPILVFLVLLSLTLHLALAALYKNSVNEAWKEKKLAIYLALATTILGLLSLSTSDIEAIRQFSLTSSLALFLSAVVGLVYWRLISLPVISGRRLFSPLISRIDFSLSKRLSLLFIFLATIIGVISFNRIGFQVEALYFFDQSTSMVKNWRHAEQRLGGMPLLDIHFNINDHSNLLTQYEEIDKKIENNINTNFSLLSPRLIVMEANRQYSGEYSLPDNMQAFQLLLGQVPSSFRPSTIDGQYTVSILGKTLQTSDYKDWINKLNLDNAANYGGLYYWMMKSQEGLIKAMAQSFFLGLILVSIFILVMMRSWRSCLIFFIVNLMPAFCTLGIFYLFGKDLNVASITTFSISFGLIVDSTLHLMFHYRRHGYEHTSFIRETVIAPMLLVTAVMVFGFLCLGLFPFSPVADFGLSMAITLFFGFIMDFYLLPTLERTFNSDSPQNTR